ncbi:uncharacterized protein LACBIDRAFT_309640 [Laccaria bicolor S238N-H82]|uniref:Predicted protein n=1 Tax=Laccaria bicolor (strain S238N-H82 / ATCC MYA-4686) TaxID=486041 RepID=B0DSQ8_LACBS|nr:uncharacterized protein LACBIDRAFT_309640 [Laccaria bicolor S238N-H82]EDR02279.1 predicted protein [Laccaria bicolor S238N-H82]|eukprot:XP_001886956.1 predicted protein [Laccaria bicolor S238N-H82]
MKVDSPSRLYGVSCVQTWYYFNRYSKVPETVCFAARFIFMVVQDVWYIKALVGGVWFFDSVHQMLISHTVYYYVISNYNNPAILTNMVWSILLEVLFNGFIGFLVQMFLTLRVWRCTDATSPSILNEPRLRDYSEQSKHPVDSRCGRIGSGGIWQVSASLLPGGCLTKLFSRRLFRCMRLQTWGELTRLKGLSITVNILAAVADILIAASLCYFLHRSRTGFKKSDTMISRLILFTVSTGMLTSICAVASLISILIWGQTLIYVAFYFSLGRLYSNSVLATLNARNGIRELGEDSDEMSFSLQNFSKSGEGQVGSLRPTNISIKIETMQDFSRERYGPESTVADGAF